ncbi:polyprenyl synthetase family protein [Intrasporangium calvum]|uniref:Polyprenyl synthetase family protein n=1 Tax=Intrasporangium calvum TaxID=53358 RepID=A0ABT5GF50_9MICO|nr:polyprenyl synthetase family protein [Intrasporangium calvum]MDC5696737.1 polyprenyl synthetase family protein [Intrasporangium calvum]
MTSPTDRDALRRRVQQALDAHIGQAGTALAEIGDDITPLVDSVSRLLTGGKGLRASFLYWGYRAAGGPDSEALVRLSASMEFFQAAALLHDDVMDRSDTRRGMPSAHRAVADLHRSRGWSGDGSRFGEGAAILAGDLCLTWCDEMYSTCGLPASELARGRGTFDLMRTQLMGGQFLDLLESARGWEGLDLDARIASARNVIRYKSAKYTIEHPLLIGARVGGAAEEALADLSAYGLALGEAFQLRDDLLGVYGDPEATGKPAGDDLREGKRTVLVALALELAGDQDRAVIEALLGREDLDESGVFRLRGIFADSGAVEQVEEMIRQRAAEAHEAVGRARASSPHGGPLDLAALTVLDELVDASTTRHA